VRSPKLAIVVAAQDILFLVSVSFTDGFAAGAEIMKKIITVRVPEKSNLDQLQKLLGSVVAKAGHPMCLSGFQITFENAVDPANIVMVTEKDHVNVREI
jgi:hypothetical protein